MEWCDTFRTSGGIEEGYYIEFSAWECPHCQKEYVVTKEADVSNAKVTKIEES